MPITWKQHHNQTNFQPTLPLAVAMLLPKLSPDEVKLKTQAILENLPLAKSIWLGEAPEPIKDFAAARNQLLNQVNESWILWLDSDELLEKNQLEWQDLRTSFQDRALAGFYLNRHDIFYEQKLNFGEVGKMSLLRLHRVNAGKFVNQVHEVFQLHQPAKTKNLPIKIYHHSHASISQFFTKVGNYAKIRASERLKLEPNLTKFRLIWELIWWPLGKFVWNFVLKQGFRDGWRGLTYAVMMSLHSCLVRIFSIEQLSDNSNQNENR